ncbi:MAG: PH domain-containing protein [Oscillospiraceae bacterium]|nr:PH domain-containing protein [Oscillospiraceae bacterium]
MEEIKTLWKDRRRRLGLPLSFTKYSLSEDRIFCEKGLLNLHEEEILLYRVRDLELKRSIGQRIFGVGSVLVHSSDKTMPILELKNIRSPKEVKELLYRQVEASKDSRRMRTMEFVGSEHHHDGDCSGDIDDYDDPN